jgi:hypothetical protein
MHGEHRQRLDAAKKTRDHFVTALREAAESVTEADAAIESRHAHVATLEASRLVAIVAGDVDLVMIADHELARLRVSLEITTSAGTAARAHHADVEAQLLAARLAVDAGARAVLDLELITLATEVHTAFDHAVSLGERLQSLSGNDPLNTPVNIAMRALPPSVTAALERLPTFDARSMPVHVLRGVTTSTEWQRRLGELAA